MQNHSMSSFIDMITDGVIVANASGVIVLSNNAATTLLGITKEKLVGSKIDEGLIAVSATGQLVSLLGMLQNHRPMTDGATLNLSVLEPSLVRGDRTQFKASIEALPVQIHNQTSGWTMVFKNSTEDVDIERAKSEIVSLVSHQLRTPINITSWYAEKLKSEKKGALNDKQKEYLDEIMAGNKRVVELVAAIVDVSKTDLEKLKSKNEDVDINGMVSEQIEDQQLLVKEKNLQLTVSGLETPVTLHGSDQEYAKRIVKAVIANAVKYSLDGGQVTIDLKPVNKGQLLDPEVQRVAENNGVIITVSDHGLGIPDYQKSQVFSKLFRADNVKALDVTGLGLGLYLASCFSKALDGYVWFDSSVGKGSNFYIYLPDKLQ